jgi:segregation and condensation protein B
MNLDALLEALLFAMAQPVGVRKLATLSDRKPEEVKEALQALQKRLDDAEGGVQLMLNGEEAELVTHPDAAEAVRAALKQEMHGELTRPSLEALAILAYRGPLTRPELEQIRGVQSALILRNLMMRGLVEQSEDQRLGQPLFAVTSEFLKSIGTSQLEDLPDYASLHTQRAVEQVLNELNPPTENKPNTSLHV